MGRHHVRNVRAVEGFDFVAVADPGGEKVDVSGNHEVLPSVDALIHAGIDAANVAVPTAYHEEAALKLAAAGVHTLVEKPLSGDVASGQRMAKASDAAGLVGAVGYVERCNPALIEIRRRLQDGSWVRCTSW